MNRKEYLSYYEYLISFLNVVGFGCNGEVYFKVKLNPLVNMIKADTSMVAAFILPSGIGVLISYSSGFSGDGYG